MSLIRWTDLDKPETRGMRNRRSTPAAPFAAQVSIVHDEGLRMISCGCEIRAHLKCTCASVRGGCPMLSELRHSNSPVRTC